MLCLKLENISNLVSRANEITQSWYERFGEGVIEVRKALSFVEYPIPISFKHFIADSLLQQEETFKGKINTC